MERRFLAMSKNCWADMLELVVEKEFAWFWSWRGVWMVRAIRRGRRGFIDVRMVGKLRLASKALMSCHVKAMQMDVRKSQNGTCITESLCDRS